MKLYLKGILIIFMLLIIGNSQFLEKNNSEAVDNNYHIEIETETGEVDNIDIQTKDSNETESIENYDTQKEINIRNEFKNMNFIEKLLASLLVACVFTGPYFLFGWTCGYCQSDNTIRYRQQQDPFGNVYPSESEIACRYGKIYAVIGFINGFIAGLTYINNNS